MAKEFTITLTEREFNNLVEVTFMKAIELKHSEDKDDKEMYAECRELFEKLWKIKINQ